MATTTATNSATTAAATAVHVCKAVSAPGTLWSFCPSMGAAIAFLVFFCMAFIVHVIQGVYYKKVYTWVIGMSALWQVLTYIFRIISIQNPASLGDYAGWFVLILVAPLWTNAFVYMVIGRMVWNYVPSAKIWKISAWRFGLVFVGLDIIAFVIQVYGAASAESNNNSVDQTLRGIHIYMAGVGVQQLFILSFCSFAFRLWQLLRREKRADNACLPVTEISRALTLLYTCLAVLALITLRICFRIVEYAHGLQSTIPNHEAYQYCLDSLPMLLAIVMFSVVHPGGIMKGVSSEIPSRKNRKRHGLTKAHFASRLEERSSEKDSA